MSLEAAVSVVEAQLQDVQAALLATDPLTLEKVAVQLRSAASTLTQVLGNTSAAEVPADISARIRAIGRQLASLRDQLARLLALTERQAASLLPPLTGVATYGSDAMPHTAMGARIYRAPG